MNDVKWIKISTNIFDDEKILLIESLPKADSILVIWFKLLCLAGKINNSGVFVLNENITYTNEMLSKIFRRKKSVVESALKVFQEFGMIEVIDDVITIPKWGEHQSLESIEKKKEYMKNYMQEYREKQKSKVCKTNSKTNSKANVSRTEEEREEDKEKDKEVKNIYGEYGHVRLTETEWDKLCNEYGNIETHEAIKYLDEYIEMKGYKAKSHYLCIRKWVFDAVKRDKAKNNNSGQSVFDAWANA